MILSRSIIDGVHALSSIKVQNVPCIGYLPLTELLKAVLNVCAYRAALGEVNVRRISWLQGYLVCIVLGTAGACSVALLRGEPMGIVYRNEVWIVYGVIYWLLFSNRFLYNSIQNLFNRFPLLKTICIGFSGMNRGYGVVQLGVDGVTKSGGAEAWIGKLLCGTLVGCGAGLWFEMLSLGQPEWQLKTPSGFLKPSDNVKASFWASVAYMVVSYFLVEKEEGHAVGSLVFSIVLMLNDIKIRSRMKKVDNKKAE